MKFTILGLAATVQAVEDFTCRMQLQNCQRETNYLDVYTKAMADTTIGAEWKLFKQRLATDSNSKRQYDADFVQWSKDNLLEDGDRPSWTEKANDDDILDIKEEESEDDGDLPWITQVALKYG
jgi:hypothetical protein